MIFLCINKQAMENEKLIILLVEDSRIIKERLICMLKELKNVQQVLDAGTYDEAFGLLQQDVADVIVLDISLPGKSGIDVLKAINEYKWEPTIIVLTNQADNYYKSLCFSLGAGHFLDKTRDFDKIPGIVAYL
jgi:DNA-binding NarL/FixJ family response regulator